jgi:hypothetical protein
MLELVIQQVTLGFGLSLILFFQGQACRIICDLMTLAVDRN